MNELIDFVNLAQKNRKYAPNTAIGLRVALRLFEEELNEQEKGSLQTFKENLDQIYLNVYRKNKDKLSAATLEVYKRRIRNLISDYEKYGNDPSKMAVWNPTLKVGKQIKKRSNVQDKKPQQEEVEEEKSSSTAFTRFELPLRPNVKAIILTPSDLTREEAGKIKKYIEYLESVT